MCKSTFRAKPTLGLCLRAPIKRSTTHYTYALTLPETHSVIRQCNNIQPAKQNSHQYSMSDQRVCQLIHTWCKTVCHLIYITALQSLSSHLYNCFTMQQLSLNVYQPLLSIAQCMFDHSSMAHQYFFNSEIFWPNFKKSHGFKVWKNNTIDTV